MLLLTPSTLARGVLTLVAVSFLAGCATLSPERRQRISDCIAQCDAGREPPAAGPMGNPGGSVHDMRSDCESRCQSMH
jgi:hypothetical protein